MAWIFVGRTGGRPRLSDRARGAGGVAAAGEKGSKHERKQERKLERELEQQADYGAGRTRVIVVLKPGVDPSQHLKELGGTYRPAAGAD